MVATLTVQPDHAERLDRSARELARAATLCREAARLLETRPAAEVVNALAGIHERDLAHLRRLARRLGLDAPTATRAHDALDELDRARRRAGDAGVLAVVREVEVTGTRAYERLRDDPALPGEVRTSARSALDELHRRWRRLEDAARVAD